MVACPPGLKVTVLVTPLVVTAIGWPTTSAPGVQACAKALPDKATVRPASVRITNELVIMKHPSGRPRGVNNVTIDRFPRSGGAVGVPTAVHGKEDPDACRNRDESDEQ